MNDNISATIEALTSDWMVKSSVEEVKDLGDKLGVRHVGDPMGRSWIVNVAKENGLALVGEDEDANMMVFS